MGPEALPMIIITFPLLLLLSADAHLIAAAISSWYGVGDVRLAIIGFLAVLYGLGLALLLVSMALAKHLR